MKNQIDPKGKVADLLTSLKMQELGLAVETEKAWYEMPNGQIEVLSEKECSYLVGHIFNDLSKKKVKGDLYVETPVKICPAPDFGELWKRLPSCFKLITGLSTENENEDCEGFFTMDHNGIGYCTEAKSEPCWLNPNYISFESANGNIAEATALLLISYLDMKKRWSIKDTDGLYKHSILEEIFYPKTL